VVVFSAAVLLSVLAGIVSLLRGERSVHRRP
jgi:hypothetical protein